MVTYGGLLFFGKEESIQKIFPDFKVDYLEIPGTSYNNAEVRDTFKLEEQENIWEYYFIIMEKIKRHVDNPFKMTSESFASEDYPHITAIREALVNMLMHADYFSNMKSRIRIFYDRIEFFNPGALPKPLQYILKTDFTSPRNPVLAKLFRAVKLAENSGYGFDKMIDGWTPYSGKPPAFIQELDLTISTFYFPEKQIQRPNDASPKTGEKTGEKIIKLIKDKPDITISELAENLAISAKGIEWQIKKLKEQGIIKRIGPDKGGYWKVMEIK